jgi:hypothetical protein
MKKTIVLSALALSMTVLTRAQTPATPSSVNLNPGGLYVKGGLNLANISTSSSGNVNSSNTMTAFHAGLMFDAPLTDMFSIQTGAFVNQKGAKSNYYANPNNQNDNYSKYSYRPLYIEVPLNFVVKVPIGTDSRVFVGVGPYAAVGVGGNYKAEVKVAGATSTVKNSITYTSDNIRGTVSSDDYGKTRRFDFGLNALAGVEINRFLVGAGYGLGLTKINAVSNSDDDRNKHRDIYFSIGYRLY